jgi:predicted dehydrogenase
VSFGYNYKPMVREAKRLMEDGGIGRIEYMTVRMASGIRELLRSGQYPSHVAVPGFPSEYATWAKAEMSGGGYAPGQLSHAMGLALWLSGLRVAEAFAWMSNGGAEVDMYDAITLKYDGGAIGTLSGGASPADWGRDQLDVRIYGSEGQLIIDVERAFVSRFNGREKEVRLPLDGSEGAYECTGPPNTLVDLALGKDVENSTPGELGARTVEPVEAAEKSVLSGRAERTHERFEQVRPAR